MAFFTVHHGKTYRAKLRLSFFEGMASNDMIADKFREIGFRHITISGSGEHRWAQGVWNGPDESVPLTDEHIESVVEVNASHAAMKAHSVYHGPVYHDEEAPSEEVQPFSYPDEEVQPAIDPFLPEEEEEVPLREHEKLGTPGDKPGDYHGGPKSGTESPVMTEKEKEEWERLHEDGG